MVVPYSPTKHLSHCLCEVQKLFQVLSLYWFLFTEGQYISVHTLLCLFCFCHWLQWHRTEMKFFTFCFFAILVFLQTSLCSSASHLWHQARFPIFTVCFLAQLSGISWNPFSAWYTVWSFGSTLISTFPFSPCALVLLLASFVSVSVFSLCGGFFEEVGGDGGQFPFWRIATPYVVFSCFAVDRAYKALVSIRYIERIR